MGADHPAVQATRRKLALVQREAGLYVQAETKLVQVMDDQIRQMGPYHPEVLKTREELGRTLLMAGKVEAAERLFSDLVADLERVLDADDPRLLRTRVEHASALRSSGNLETAEMLARSVLVRQYATLKPDLPEVFVTRRLLAAISRDAGTSQHPERLLRKLWEESSAALRHDHPEVLAIGGDYGTALLQCNEVEAAEEVFRTVLSRVAADRAQVAHASVLRRFADTLAERGNDIDADSWYADILQVQLALLPEDHPEVLKTKKQQAIHAYNTESPGAVEMFQAVLNYQEGRGLGANRAEILDIKNRLAFALADDDQVDIAIGLLQEVIDEVTNPEDPADLRTFDARYELAYCVATRSYRPDEGQLLFEQLLADESRLLPKDHPQTQRTRSELESLRDDADNVF